MSKLKLKFSCVLLMVIMFVSGFMPLTVRADEEGEKAPNGSIIVEFPAKAATDGKYFYYCPSWELGLIKRNIKTGKEIEIFNRYISDISVSENNIIFTDERASNTSWQPHVYKTDKNGKNAKELAVGHSPVILGKYIYYIGGEIKEVTGEPGSHFSSDGIYRMSLSGKGKKKISDIDAVAIGKWGNKIYCEIYDRTLDKSYYCDLKGSRITEVIYSKEYSTKKTKRYKFEKDITGYNENGNELFEGSYKEGKWKYKVLAKFKDEKIQDVIYCGNKFIVFTNGIDKKYGSCGKAYILSNNGKKKTFLRKWYLAG